MRIKIQIYIIQNIYSSLPQSVCFFVQIFWQIGQSVEKGNKNWGRIIVLISSKVPYFQRKILTAACDSLLDGLFESIEFFHRNSVVWFLWKVYKICMKKVRETLAFMLRELMIDLCIEWTLNFIDLNNICTIKHREAGRLLTVCSNNCTRSLLFLVNITGRFTKYVSLSKLIHLAKSPK